MPGQGVVARNLSLRSHFGADRHSTLSLATLYFALFLGDPGGSGVEPSSVGNYARVAKTNDATLWGTVGSTDVTVGNAGSAGAIVWPTATAVYSITSPLDHWAVFDNASTGVLWYWGVLGTPITVTGAGDIPRIPASALICSQPA